MFQIGSIKYNIVKLVFCSKHKKISALHYKEDGMYYVAIIDIEKKEIEFEIPLNLSFYSSGLWSLDTFPNAWSNRMSEIYPKYSAYAKFYHINDNVDRVFTDLRDLKLFEVNFDKKEILLFTNIQEYTFKNSKLSDNIFYKYRLLLYSFEGDIIKQIDKDINEKLEHVSLIKPDKILFYKESWKNDLEIFNYNSNTTCTFDLLNNEYIFREKEFCDYEYLDEMQSINNSNLIGYIVQHPTYGAYGVQIIRYTETEIQPIYDLEIIDNGNFQSLTFNYSGNEFSVIGLNNQDEFLSIIVYSISENDYNPKKVINTKYKYNADFDSFNILRYYKNDKIVIVKSNKIVIYNLISGNLEI